MKKIVKEFKKRMLVIVLMLTCAPTLLPVYAGQGQILHETSVTIALKSGSLESALRDLHRHTKITFAYDRQLISAYKVDRHSFSNERLDYVLEKLLQHKSLGFAEVNNIIVISKLTTPASSIGNPARQEVVVSGIIRDETGKPLPGVSVAVRGVSTMTTTDAEGKYKILVNPDNAVLAFSFIGYETAEVTVGGQTVINLQLKLASKSLGEVAVVGFGTQRKVSLVGAQSTINPSEFKQPASDISTMLAGRISGVVGVQRSGEPGKSGADIWIRGIATFGDGNKSTPLVLVDGVERAINNISPEDIESFTILKDAAGTAVYGVRGANGVILLKTKTGKVGKPQIYFDYNEGVNSFTKRPKMLDGITYMNLANEAST